MPAESGSSPNSREYQTLLDWINGGAAGGRRQERRALIRAHQSGADSPTAIGFSV